MHSFQLTGKKRSERKLKWKGIWRQVRWTCLGELGDKIFIQSEEIDMDKWVGNATRNKKKTVSRW